MSRVLRVMVMLAFLTLAVAVSAQPAHASNVGNPEFYQDGTTMDDSGGQEEFDATGEPTEGGEGDPDSVGGGYGARAGDSILGGLMGGLFGFGIEDLTFEEYIHLMLQQFVPLP